MKYQIWMEGFLCTGMEGTPEPARYLGEVEANSWQEACDIQGRSMGLGLDYNSEQRSWWGCRFFDNEQDARKTFG